MDKFRPKTSQFHVISCATVIEEMRSQLPSDMGLEILDFGLHSRPEKLRKELQAAIDRVEDHREYVILGYGLCSFATAGLVSQRHTLILPKVHDCIALFLGSQEALQEQAQKELGTLYLTKGFIESERGEVHVLEYEQYKKRYGLEKAKTVLKIMLKHYTRIALINTGEYHMERYRRIAKDLADEFDLSFDEIPGSMELLVNLVSGVWDEDVLMFPPGQRIEERYFLGNEGN
jgi:hypothetical protein